MSADFRPQSSAQLMQVTPQTYVKWMNEWVEGREGKDWHIGHCEGK